MSLVLRFDIFELDPRALELKREGATVPLRPQPCRLLRCLAMHPGTLVTRDELRDQLWPAGVFVRFDQGLNSCMRQIRAALGDDYERPRFIETLPRRGYRFLVPVSQVSTAAKGSGRPRIAVLPFSAIQAADAAQALVTEGFSEELTSRLAGLRPDRLGVLHHEGCVTDPRLEADYLVKGSIRRAGTRMRITAHLINAQDNTHVWGRSYERAVEDPFLWQDEAASTIAREIVGTLRLPVTA